MKKLLQLIGLASLMGLPDFARASSDVLLDSGFGQLEQGRAYLVDFPTLKTAGALVQDYLGADTNGVFDGSTDSFTPLSSALDAFIAVRNDPSTSEEQADYAKVLASESLEALLNGQLYSGNSDLLSALRVAFPIAGQNQPPGAQRPLPLELPINDKTQAEYAGANLINLGYARLHFFRGIATLLDFLSADPTGEFRTVDYLTYPAVPNYTVFNTTNTGFNDYLLPFPRFADTNFLGQGPQPSQTAGYLYSTTLNRYGIANVSIANNLWHAAFFGAANKPVRQEMLDKAAQVLRRGIHAQFLACLPLAATLNDGTVEGENSDYQTIRMEQNRSSVTAAVGLLQTIQSGAAPKLDGLNLNIDDGTLQAAISDAETSVAGLDASYAKAQTDIQRLQMADALQAADVQAIRTQFESQLVSITGIDPSQSPYSDLSTSAQRDLYRNTIVTLYDQRMKAGLGDTNLLDGSTMGQAALNVLKAFSDVQAAQGDIAAIPQEIQIEEDKNNELDSVVTAAGIEIGAVDVAVGIIKATVPSVTVGYPGNNVTYAPGAALVASEQVLQDFITTDKETSINDINSRANIRNLLLQQAELVQKLPSVVAQAQLAIANMNALYKQALRLIDDDVFFQNNVKDLWYHDPSVVFQQCQTELEYQQDLTLTTAKLYELSQKLASRWSEQYQNPFEEGDGFTYVTLDSAGEYDDFTEPESAFTITDNDLARRFYLALQTWDSLLRSYRPAPSSSPTTTISLRQDLLGLADYTWNTNNSTFVLDPAKQSRNIASFRAYLLNAQQNNAAKDLLELTLGINYFTPKRSTVTGTGFSADLIPRSSDDWNQRLTSVSARVHGQNVTALSTVPLTIFQYGKCYVEGYFNKDDAAHVDDLALYYPDPRSLAQDIEWEGHQQFVVEAAVDGVNPMSQDVHTSAMTPFCDRYLLTIENSLLTAPVNLENITDIELTLAWTVGQPPIYTWPTPP